jgi:polysaccharide biosynthesis transport protein
MLFDSKDPQLSADFVNGLADEFQTREFETKANANDTTAKWLSQQLGELKTKLETSELTLQTYARSADLIVTEDKSNVAEEKLREVQQEYSKAQADRASKESQYETAAASPPDSVSAVLDSDLVRDYRTRLSELRRQLADFDVVLTPDNPKVKRLKAQITEIESALMTERSNILRDIGNQANTSKRREAKLRAAFDQQSKTVSDMAFRSVRYDLLKREVDTNRNLYDSMLQKIKSTRVASALQSSNIHVIDRATVPTSPYSPNKPLDVALGLMVGLFGGIVAAFLIEYSDGTLRGLGVAPTVLRVPELGAIPSASRELPATCTAMVPVSKKSGTGGQPEDFALETISWNGTHSPLTASYKAVLTSILFQSRKRQHPRVIAVTSPSAGEGKTTTATNLAIAAAGILGRVLIIDADHYRPVVHSIFNVSNSWGLSELLRENQDLEGAPLEALARTTEIPGLYVLPSGGANLNTSDLLHSKRMGTLLRRLREEFEMIVIDTPPTLVAPDARVIGRHSDGMILVLRNGKTNLNSALAVTTRFKEDQTPILGTVLNDWDYKRDKSGYFGDYYGAEAYRRAE